jgi:Carboxypeptidase regulatory-like domain
MRKEARATIVHSTREDSLEKPLGGNIWRPVLRYRILIFLGVSTLLWAFPSPAQSQQPPDQQSLGRIIGTVLDQTGAAVAGARVTLARDDQSPGQDVLSGDDGQFAFANIAPGPFHLTVTSAGFATQSVSGILHSGEVSIVPQITLAVAPNVTEVRVEPTQAEVAEIQIKDEEKQRVLGVVPNFYVSYIPDAAPLSAKQKFELAWKDTIDPVTFGITAAAAGIEQGSNQFGGYGYGAEGYGKRYGAAYADLVTSTFIGSAVLPSLLHQDPRYFYRGTGTVRARLLYAIANAVICKGDNKRWQANYSSILGNLASAGISNLYYPAKDTGVGLTFENAFIGTGAAAAANVLQEFVVRKLTPNAPKRGSAKQ